jgi:arginyl-tRNA synthetase
MFKQYIITQIQQALEKIAVLNQEVHLDHPTNEQFGDYTTTIALQLAKELKKNPLDVAHDIASHINLDEVITKVEVIKPGFINFTLSQQVLTKELAKINQQKHIYGHSDWGKGKTVIVEFSSPNIAKPFTIGHLRSTIIGDSIAKLLEATGWNVKKDNHIGDWGTQFGKQIYAIKTWGNEEEIESAEQPVKKLVELYVTFHNEAEKNLARRLWKKCIEWSWKEFSKIYEQLHVNFTENEGRGYGESFFEDKMEAITEELDKKGLLKESEGAKLIFFPNEKYPPLMIMKKDGTTLYATRDLATDKFRLERYGREILVINEVGAEQSLYFQQLFEIEEMLGWYKKGQRVHVKHGLYRFKDQKMSTRKGNTIWLEDVLEEAEKKAFELRKQTTTFIHGSSDKTNNNSSVAQDNFAKIGIAALKWNDLKRSSHLDVVFDWKEILNMEGNSGPYLLYTYVRCRSILEKEQSDSFTSNVNLTNNDLILMRTLILFPDNILSAAQQFSPHILANFLFDLAQKFNLFYQKQPILKAEGDLKNFRLNLTQATAHVLKNGLYLLGIETVDKM